MRQVRLKTLMLVATAAVALGVGIRQRPAAGAEIQQTSKDNSASVYPASHRPDERTLPPLPPIIPLFQCDFEISLEEGGQSKVIAMPSLVSLEGREAMERSRTFALR
jgi:hypothetical protein